MRLGYRIGWVCLGWGLGFAAGAGGDSDPSPLCEALAAGRLCVQNRVPDDAPLWYLTGPGGAAQKLAGPQLALSQVAEFLLSPDGAYLAAVSVGEGHPILDLVSLPEVLAGRAAPPLLRYNPYPGFVNLQAWRDGVLYIQANRVLPERLDRDGLSDPGFSHADELDRAWNYRVNPASGAVAPMPTPP